MIAYVEGREGIIRKRGRRKEGKERGREREKRRRKDRKERTRKGQRERKGRERNRIDEKERGGWRQEERMVLTVVFSSSQQYVIIHSLVICIYKYGLNIYARHY